MLSGPLANGIPLGGIQSGDADLAKIPVVKPGRVPVYRIDYDDNNAQRRVQDVDPKTGEPWTTLDLGDVLKYILATSPSIKAENYKQLSEELGLSYATVRDWYTKGSSPNLESLSNICARLNMNPVQLFLQWEEFTHNLAQRHGAVFDRIAAILATPENAQKLLNILLEEKGLGILDSFLDHKSAELGVNPEHPVRSLNRPANRRQKKT